MAKKFDLAALMGETVSKSDTGEMRVEQIPLVEIEENKNNSYSQNDIDELAESIKVIGLQQPLVVRRKPEGGYLLLAGHRRRNALALLDRKAAPCIVLDADLDPSLQVLSTPVRRQRRLRPRSRIYKRAAWLSCRASCAVMLPRCSKLQNPRSPGRRRSTTA